MRGVMTDFEYQALAALVEAYGASAIIKYVKEIAAGIAEDAEDEEVIEPEDQSQGDILGLDDEREQP